MKKITSIADLNESILLLEIKKEIEFSLLKEQFHSTCESLKPLNLIKSSIKEAILAPDLKTRVVNAAIGFTTGFVAKKVFVGMSHNPLTKLLGIVLEMAVANKVAQNADGIKSMGSILLEKILNNKPKTT